MTDDYLEKGEEEAKKCRHYDGNCYCGIDGATCYVFGNKIHKVKNCDAFEQENDK